MPYLSANDSEIFYETRGSGRPLLLLHGALIDHHLWDPQMDHFSQRFQVIRYDMRGHGQTRSARLPRYSMRLFAADLFVLVEELQLDRPLICGLSLGGMVAQVYASLHPERLSALILCDTAASSTLTLVDKLQTYLFGWSLAPTVRLLGSRAFTDYSFLMGRLMRGEDWFGQNAPTREYVRSRMREMPTHEMALVYDMIIRFRAVDLSAVRVPALILNGEHETKSVFTHQAYLQAKIPGSQTAVIPNAGHVSSMENPVAFNQAVLEFLEGHGLAG